MIYDAGKGLIIATNIFCFFTSNRNLLQSIKTKPRHSAHRKRVGKLERSGRQEEIGAWEQGSGSGFFKSSGNLQLSLHSFFASLLSRDIAELMNQVTRKLVVELEKRYRIDLAVDKEAQTGSLVG